MMSARRDEQRRVCAAPGGGELDVVRQHAADIKGPGVMGPEGQLALDVVG